MFKYNSLSDLKDGTLTLPLRKEDGFIICQNENGTIVKKTMSDFDFLKKPEEREFILGTDLTSEMEKDLIETKEPVESTPVVEPVIAEQIVIATTEPEVVESVVETIVEPVKPVIKTFIKPFIIKEAVDIPSNITGKNIKVSVETQRIV